VVDCYPYLGVTISSDLRWHKHVDSVSAKAFYISLIRPHLEFASAAWDPHTDRDINQLDKVQRRAVHLVKNDYHRTTSVSGPVRDLGCQSLENRKKNTHLLLFYKGLHGLSAIPCDSLRRPVRNSRH